ncbi:MAG TPA: hypothetical protein VIC54_11470 [Terriglobales bacterium]
MAPEDSPQSGSPHLDVINTADWVIDLGPEGGAQGGYVVAAGPPEAIAACAASFTGRALRPVLDTRLTRPHCPPIFILSYLGYVI